ncbi:MAG: hypothetical protein EBZ36_08910, partial [Acidobacteria bacterium]|nr:hypothetical protein [Acidobacteriota bacterium]
MKAVLYEQFGVRPELCQVPDPVPAADGVVLQVMASGICRSDWHGWVGHDPDIHVPHVPGHELAGIVVAKGSEVRRWQIGDRVTVPFVCGCGACQECCRGDQQVCREQFQPGFTHWGSFAEYVAIYRADLNLVRLPEGLDFEVAASLGPKLSQPVWVLTAEVWTQEVRLSPAQISGLTPDQLERALSFEAEPFSGISAMEGATGFHDLGGGTFAVAQIPRSDRDSILHALKAVGAKPIGIAHPGIVPEGDEALLDWWPRLAAGLSSLPVIAPPAPEPSPHRFLVAGIATAAVAAGLLLALGLWNAFERAVYEQRLAQLTAASRQLAEQNKQNEAIR